MSSMEKNPRDYQVSEKAFNTNDPFKPFQVIDAGNDQVAINFGYLIFGSSTYLPDSGSYEGTVRPQDVIGKKLNKALFLPVVKDDVVCLTVKNKFSGTRKFEIVAFKKSEVKKKEQALKDGILFRLAEIVASESIGDSKYLNIVNLLETNIVFFSDLSYFQGILGPLTPFIVNTGTDDVPIYKAKVTNGHVNERVPGYGDALIVHEIKDIKWGANAPQGKSPEDLREYDIAIGKQISVVVYVLEIGLMGQKDLPDEPKTKLVIEDENTESVHYAPPCGDDEVGTVGTYHYKLGVFKAPDANNAGPWIEKYLGGSHISHFRELPLIDNYSPASEGLGRVVGKYDFDENKYKFRGVRGRYGLNLLEAQDTISLDFDGENVGGAEEVLIVPESEDIAEGKVQFRTLRGLNSDEESEQGMSRQINVSTEDSAEPESILGGNILIRGNSAVGSLIFYDTDLDFEAGRLEWQDGLVTSSGDNTINFGSIGGSGSGMGSGLINGNQGDMLHWNSGVWTLLGNPGAPSSGNLKVLTHDGTSPGWMDFIGIPISICVSGSPTTVTVYKTT